MLFIKSFRTHIIFLALSFLIIAACGDSDTSTDDSSTTSTDGTATSSDGTTVVDSSQATVTLSSSSLEENESLSLSFDLGTLAKLVRSKDGNAGTVRWGDNTQTRVRGSGSVSHSYATAGTYSISVQIDGGESVRVATVIVTAQETVAVSVVPRTGTLGCRSKSSLELQSSSGTLYSITHVRNRGGAKIKVSVNGIPNSSVFIGYKCLESVDRSGLGVYPTGITLEIAAGSSDFRYDAN